MQRGRRSARTREVPCLVLMLVGTFLLSACASAFDPLGGAATLAGAFDARTTTHRLVPNEPSEYAFFASAVAIDGQTIVVGAWGDADAGRNSGAAYVFERSDDVWVQTARLTAPDAAAGARFGHAVTIGSDTILVGAIYHEDRGFRSGAVYVFERSERAWTYTDTLTPVGLGPEAHFGAAVDLFGGVALVGASGPGARAAFVFERTDAGWVESAMLETSAGGPNERFGSSVAIHGDTALVGAYSGSPDDSPPSGAAYLFERSGPGWQQTAVLGPTPHASAGQFGFAVGLSDDTAIVGAPGESETVWIFRRDPDTWTLENTLVSPASSFVNFGTSVAISDDLLVVGAPGVQDDSGAAYVFERSGGAWTAGFMVMPPGAAGAAQLAGAVAVDLGTIVLGATGDPGGGIASGAAFTIR